MFILFGWPERKIGEQSLSVHCSGCQRDTVHRAFTQQSWFTFFFIPIFPIGAKHPHAICNICGRDAHDPIPTLGAPPRVRAEVPPLLAGGGASRPTKRCPVCSEDILLDAAACRFCHGNFSAEEVALGVQDHEARMRAVAAAAQQAELAKQRQQYLERLHGGLTRRLVFGTILTGIGGLMVLLMTVAFFAVPPGSTEHEQRMDAVALGSLLGLFPLVSGIATLLTAKPARRFLLAERNAPPRQ